MKQSVKLAKVYLLGCKKHDSSEDTLATVLEVMGSISAAGEEKSGVHACLPLCHLQG